MSAEPTSRGAYRDLKPEVPSPGFGVYKIPPEHTADAVITALEVGYRHIDTAQMYRNEAEVGSGITNSGVPREDIFLTTKLDNHLHEPGAVRTSLERSLRELKTDYVDLFLVHWPLPGLYGGDLASTWEAMIDARERGLVHHIGVSNFEAEHLNRIFEATGVPPQVNQIESHVLFSNERTDAASRALGAVVEAWSPLAQGAVFTNPGMVDIAHQTGLRIEHLALRSLVERGTVPIVKSSRRERMEENLQAATTPVPHDILARLGSLDRGASGRVGPDPNTFNRTFEDGHPSAVPADKGSNS